MTIQYLSQEKFTALQEELEHIQKVLMPHTATRIDEAKQMGDLKENAEYHAARERMGWLGARARDIESIISNAEIVTDQSEYTDTVTIGSTVTISVQGKRRQYKIVGAQEADPLSGNISNESPIGSALLGKKKGDSVPITLPTGIQQCDVIEIQ